MKKITVTIALPAYNEEENINTIISSLFNQNIKKFILKNIVVYTDGSTDKTVEKVKELKKRFSQLQLKEGKINKGKLYRLNEIYRDNTSDILVILDADIGLCSKDFLENLVSAIITDKNVMLATAHTVPLHPKNLIGKIVSSPFMTWEYIRLSIPNYNSVHNLSGQATAYRGSFVKKLFIPREATEERIYLYLMAQKENPHGFNYVLTAEMRYWPITTMYDLIKMSTRSFGRKQKVLDDLFGFNTESIIKVPRKYKIIGILKALLHEPLIVPTGIILNILIPQIVKWGKTEKTPLWERSSSTKQVITIIK